MTLNDILNAAEKKDMQIQYENKKYLDTSTGNSYVCSVTFSSRMIDKNDNTNILFTLALNQYWEWNIISRNASTLQFLKNEEVYATVPNIAILVDMYEALDSLNACIKNLTGNNKYQMKDELYNDVITSFMNNRGRYTLEDQNGYAD